MILSMQSGYNSSLCCSLLHHYGLCQRGVKMIMKNYQFRTKRRSNCPVIWNVLILFNMSFHMFAKIAKKTFKCKSHCFLFWTCLRFLSIVWILGSKKVIAAQLRTECYNSVTQCAANSGDGWHHELQLYTTHLSTESRMLQWDLTCYSVY